MSKRVEIDGRFYRLRRGRLVEIPAEWVGQVAFAQQRRRRHWEAAMKRESAKTASRAEASADLQTQGDES